MDQRPLRILFAVAEAYPFAKAGGLADVGGALPKALARRGHDVRLVLPGYPSVGPGEPVRSLTLPLGRAIERVDIRAHGRALPGVDVYTVGSARYFSRDLEDTYQSGGVLPFVVFARAAVALAAEDGWRPEVIHGHDWHLGLVPQEAREGQYGAALARTGTVLTIHNHAYQGTFGPDIAAAIDAGHAPGPHGAGPRNLLARGIARADAVNAVSRHYLLEIMTPERGMGLDGLLRARHDDLAGILNGVDYEEFNPSTDRHLSVRYGGQEGPDAGGDDGSVPAGKRRNKRALQERSGLNPDPDAPLLSMISRLNDQKGVDLLLATLDRLVALGAQLIVLGVGEERYERALAEAEWRRRGAVAYYRLNDEPLARLIYAGADCFLAPSVFEPCGLAPLIALRYGTIPIVRRTGGLAETIRDEAQEPGTGLGFAFNGGAPAAFVDAIRAALALYRQPDRWRALQRRAMAADFSWERAVPQYEQLYAHALARRQERSAAAGDPLGAALVQPLQGEPHA